MQACYLGEVHAVVRLKEEGYASNADPCPGAYFETWMMDGTSVACFMLSTRADILLTGQALRPLGQQDLPLPVRQVRVAFPSAQEPPQDRVDCSLPSPEEKGYL